MGRRKRPGAGPARAADRHGVVLRNLRTKASAALRRGARAVAQRTARRGAVGPRRGGVCLEECVQHTCPGTNRTRGRRGRGPTAGRARGQGGGHLVLAEPGHDHLPQQTEVLLRTRRGAGGRMRTRTKPRGAAVTWEASCPPPPAPPRPLRDGALPRARGRCIALLHDSTDRWGSSERGRGESVPA